MVRGEKEAARNFQGEIVADQDPRGCCKEDCSFCTCTTFYQKCKNHPRLLPIQTPRSKEDTYHNGSLYDKMLTEG